MLAGEASASNSGRVSGRADSMGRQDAALHAVYLQAGRAAADPSPARSSRRARFVSASSNVAVETAPARTAEAAGEEYELDRRDGHSRLDRGAPSRRGATIIRSIAAPRPRDTSRRRGRSHHNAPRRPCLDHLRHGLETGSAARPAAGPLARPLARGGSVLEVAARRAAGPVCTKSVLVVKGCPRRRRSAGVRCSPAKLAARGLLILAPPGPRLDAVSPSTLSS
jgi:hypothetical protein